MDLDPIDELEYKAELAYVQLGVAEELGWPIGILSAYAVNLKWHWPWYLCIPLAIAIYFAVRYQYAKREAAAEDAHHRAAKLGKYVVPYQDPDADLDDA